MYCGGGRGAQHVVNRLRLRNSEIRLYKGANIRRTEREETGEFKGILCFVVEKSRRYFAHISI
jgi:hypothetical protein